jgi:hypothetical protein
MRASDSMADMYSAYIPGRRQLSVGWIVEWIIAHLNTNGDHSTSAIRSCGGVCGCESIENLQVVVNRCYSWTFLLLDNQIVTRFQ